MEKTTKAGGTVYFNNSRNLELSELQEDLSSTSVDTVKEAMKQLIASMTVGKDVASLFPHVVKNMLTPNVELKKLIYLYIINYAKIKPDLSLMAVNAFSKDATDKDSPLIRGLAVRTMGCIRIDQVIDYLKDTLSICLRDPDAYVRKTSCICVAKLYSTNPSLVRENGLIDILLELLSDGNANVVANSLAALNEISILSGENQLNNKLNSKVIKRILNALNESNEWGQVYILDALASYKAKKTKYCQEIVEGCLPRLNHSNPAVVMSAIKVVLKFVSWIDSPDQMRTFLKKTASSLVSLMNSDFEIQYVLLRSLYAIIQKNTTFLENDYKHFFIQYNDPIYIKLEKVDILYKLTTQANFTEIINELKNYAKTEFDPELIKKSIRYIGYVGYKFENSLSACVSAIGDLLEHNSDQASSEGLQVMRDLLRQYRSDAKELLLKVNENLVYSATDAGAKSAILYIIGEFCSSIENSTELINIIAEDFSEESTEVKLQILSAVVKNYVCDDSPEAETLIKELLQKGANESENPDVRDRAYIFWRLLESDPNLAKQMVTESKPRFDFVDGDVIEENMIDNLVENMTNISAIYHKTSSELIPKEDMVEDEAVGEEQEEEEKPQVDDIIGEKKQEEPKEESNHMDDIFGSTVFGNSAVADTGSVEIFEDTGSSLRAPELFISSNASSSTGQSGLTLHGVFHRKEGQIYLGLQFHNRSVSPISDFTVSIDKNSFGLNVEENQAFSLDSEEKRIVKLPVSLSGSNKGKSSPSCPLTLSLNISCSIGDFNVEAPFYILNLFFENKKLDSDAFKTMFGELKNKSSNVEFTINREIEESELTELFLRNNLFFVAKVVSKQPHKYYYSGSIGNSIKFILQVAFLDGALEVTVMCAQAVVVSLIEESVNFILNN